MLRIRDFGFARQHSEKLGIEKVDIPNDTTRPDVIRLPREFLGVRYLQLFDTKLRDRLNSFELVLPEFRNARRTRKATRHSYDSHTLEGVGGHPLLAHVVPPFTMRRLAK